MDRQCPLLCSIVPVNSQINPLDALAAHFLRIQFNINSHPRLSLQSDHYPSASHQNPHPCMLHAQPISTTVISSPQCPVRFVSSANLDARHPVLFSPFSCYSLPPSLAQVHSQHPILEDLPSHWRLTFPPHKQRAPSPSHEHFNTFGVCRVAAVRSVMALHFVHNIYRWGPFHFILVTNRGHFCVRP